MMINCVSTNSSRRQQYGKVLYMVRGIQSQDFLNILNKNNAKVAISQAGVGGGETSSTNGSVGKIVLASLGSETQIEQQQHEGLMRLENTESVLKNGQLILKNIDKSHSVLLIRSTPAATATSAVATNNDSSTPQAEHTNMSIETLEANSGEDNNENTVVASTQKIGASPLVNSGK
jgi:hypothetical protein